MKLLSTALSAAAVAASLLPGLATAAEEGVVKMMSPWESTGEVFRTGEDQVLFLGVAEGIVYIEDGEGALDSALLVCPGTREIAVESGMSEAHGRCILTSSTGDQVFASYQCKGDAERCEGEFKLDGGTGRFAGITGEGELYVRTALVAMAVDKATGATVSGAAGLAVWPELAYKIP